MFDWNAKKTQTPASRIYKKPTNSGKARKPIMTPIKKASK
jgi:hypothetical protein